MKQTNLLLAALILTSLSLLPAAATAQELDDLDVTMEVVDDVEGIGDVVIEMRGPETTDGDAGEAGFSYDGSDGSSDGEFAEGAEQEVAEEDDRFGRPEDKFVIDKDFDESEDNLGSEGDFDEGEEIDDDQYDIPMPEDDGMEEDPMADEV